MQTAKQGDCVKVHYVKQLQDGSKVTSHDRAPLDIIVGVAHPRLPGLGLALVGLAPGDRAQVRVPPERAYGPSDPARMRRWSRKRFMDSQALVVGRWVKVKNNQGRPRQVRIVEIHDKMVVVDTNHRGAGQVLDLEVELVFIQAAAPSPDHPAP